MRWARILSPWLAAVAAFSIDAATAEPASERYQLDRLVPASNFHGVHGLAFDANGVLYAGSVVGHSIYRVDTATGAVTTFVGAPDGMADDLVFLADGTVVATCGMVVTEGRGRYQSVDTHVDHRRKGYATRLVHDVGREAIDRFGAAHLVIVASVNYHAKALYESLGFVDRERSTAAVWRRAGCGPRRRAGPTSGRGRSSRRPARTPRPRRADL